MQMTLLTLQKAQKISKLFWRKSMQQASSKTKYMTISKNALLAKVLTLYREIIERVERYTYLGSMVNSKQDQPVEVRCRFKNARTVFNKMKTFFVSRNLKIRMVRCYVLLVLLYGVESWTMTDALMRRLDSFEMWIYRRILMDRAHNQ